VRETHFHTSRLQRFGIVLTTFFTSVAVMIGPPAWGAKTIQRHDPAVMAATIDAPPQLDQFGRYAVNARHSGQCLDIAGASQNNGAHLIQWPCHYNQNQQWTSVAAGAGYYRLVVRHSGKCLDVDGASQNNGAHLIQWPCHLGNNQQWRFVYLGNGYYRLVARHSGKCLDVDGASQNNGAHLIQWPCHLGNNQQWRFTAAA
jgi:hypothetical protein